MFAGKLDHHNFDSIKGFNIWLQKNKSDVKIIEYEEGHNIPEIALEKELKIILK